MPWRTSVAVLFLALTAPAGAQPPDTLALVTTYADGRTTESPIGPDGRRAWTPLFPRVPGFRDPAGLAPVRALNTQVTRAGAGLRVVVSVLRGWRSHETEEAVATVEVFAHQPATVHELRRVGLMPVTYAVAPFAAPVLDVPAASSRVEGLTIEGIEPRLDPVPAYRVVVRNTTDTPLVSFAIDAYRSGADALSTQQGDPAAQPIVAPGEVFAFTLTLTGGSPGGQPYATVAPVDHIALTGGLWADGRTGGDPRRSGMLMALHRGRLHALEAALQVLRAGPSADRGDAVATMRRLRDTLASQPGALDAAAVARIVRTVPALTALAPVDAAAVIVTGSQDARRRVLEDLDRVLGTATPALAQRWLSEAREACEAWHLRLSTLFLMRP